MAKITPLLIAVFGIAIVCASPSEANATDLQPMPAELEARFALSALPAPLRGSASVYLLDPKTGYRLSRQGTSGLACLVERTAWELADFRDDIYIPLCYDAAGTRTYLQVKIDAAKLRAEGIGPAALRAKIASLWADKTYTVPEKPGLSYMVAPIMRTIGPPDLKVHTMAMPHLMFYAPGVTNADIGAAPDLANHATLLNPFIDRQGSDEQSYMIQILGDAEKARILADEKRLTDDLCAYRDVLCLNSARH